MRSIKPKGILKILGIAGLITFAIITLKYGFHGFKPVDIEDVNYIDSVKTERRLSLKELERIHGKLPVSFEAYFAGDPEAKSLRGMIADTSILGNPEDHLRRIKELEGSYRQEFDNYDVNGDEFLDYSDDTNGDGYLSSKDDLSFKNLYH